MGYALQMSWMPSLPNQKRKNGPPLGLRNLGNTCYLNSVLQCLTYTPPLANFCLKYLHSSSCDAAKVSAAEKKSECPFCIIEKRIVRSLRIEAALDSPVKINNCLKIFAEHFRHGRQEDAHEFLRYVIDACHNTCLRINKLQQQRRKSGSLENGTGSGNTVVKEIFGGALQSQIKCLSCGAESNKVDEIMDISLDVLNSKSVKEALMKFFQPEVLDGNNKYKCENCKKLVAARKQMTILQAPNVLVIQLKRFDGIFGGKIDKQIAFEEVLVLSSYMCKASQDPYPEYNLFGTIVHSGFSADSGHYYANIKDAIGRWYCCNDSFVSVSTLQEVLSEKVYILFFSRGKQRLVPSKTGFVENGKKSHESNGILTSKISRSNCLDRPVLAKQFSDHMPSKTGFVENGKKSHETNGILTSKISRSDCLDKPVLTKQFSDHNSQIANKMPSFPPKKLTVFENSNIIRPPAAGNIRILVHKRESLEKNGHLVHGEEKEKTTKSVIDRNGKSELVDDAGMKKPFSIANGNGKTHSICSDILADHFDDDKERSRTLIASGPEKELVTDDIRCSSKNSYLKRKFQIEDRCILLAKDAKSRAKVDEFKESIAKQASLFLNSSGWSDEVYNFMQSRKQLCAQREASDASTSHELKRILIADAKSNFRTQIPESLKGSLIERLRSFAQQKRSSTNCALNHAMRF